MIASLSPTHSLTLSMTQSFFDSLRPHIAVSLRATLEWSHWRLCLWFHWSNHSSQFSPSSHWLQDQGETGAGEMVPIIVASVKVDTCTFSNCEWCYIWDAIASKWPALRQRVRKTHTLSWGETVTCARSTSEASVKLKWKWKWMQLSVQVDLNCNWAAFDRKELDGGWSSGWKKLYKNTLT